VSDASANGLAATARLLAETFPGSDISAPAYLDWLYVRSPFGPVIESNLDDEQGRAGHYALVPIALSREGAGAGGALSLNTAVHARARGGGTFVRLATETIDAARRRGVDTILGVANANSTPGFIRRLEFELVCPLPVTLTLPLPLPALVRGIDSAWHDDASFAAGGPAADAGALLAPPAVGETRRWTEETLAWRLQRPGARYALHRADDLLAVTCAAARGGVPVAVLLKVFAAAPLGSGRSGALVRAVCRFHRAPVALHAGLSDLLALRGSPLPARLRPSPLNLIRRRLAAPPAAPPVVRFEFLDFDAY